MYTDCDRSYTTKSSLNKHMNHGNTLALHEKMTEQRQASNRDQQRKNQPIVLKQHRCLIRLHDDTECGAIHIDEPKQHTYHKRKYHSNANKRLKGNHIEPHESINDAMMGVDIDVTDYIDSNQNGIVEVESDLNHTHRRHMIQEEQNQMPNIIVQNRNHVLENDFDDNQQGWEDTTDEEKQHSDESGEQHQQFIRSVNTKHIH